MDLKFMTAQLEEAGLPVVENDDTGVLVTPEEDTATSTEEIIAEEEQIELYCQSLSAMMEEIYCINDTITLYGDSGARMASRLFPNAPVDMLVAGQEGLKEILKSIWDYICKLWKRVVGFLSKVFSRIFGRRSAADEWEKEADEWLKALSNYDYRKYHNSSYGHGRGAGSNSSSSSTGGSNVIEVYDPKEVKRYANRLQIRLQSKFGLEGIVAPAQDLLELLKSNNQSSDNVLKKVEDLRARVHAKYESAKEEKSIHAEDLHKIKKTRVVLTSATLKQLNKDLEPLIKAQLRIKGWQSNCDKVSSIAKEITVQTDKLASATGSDEEVKTARSISGVSTEVVKMLTTVVSHVGVIFTNINSIIDNYIKPIRAIAEKIAPHSSQSF